MESVGPAIASLQPELWTASLNEAITIYITDTAGSAQSFQPSFTYPIFGESETIFGYQDLQIFLCFDSVTFLPFLNVKWSQKLDEVDVDPKEKLLELLPESTVFKDELKWRDAIDAEQKEYKIPGEIVGDSWSKDGETYGIYKIDMSLKLGVELLRRLQILVLLFIEAGTYIEHDDAKWDIYVMYKTTDPKLPEIVGFATAYNYWSYPGAEKFEAGETRIRKKLSQFIVLPVFQGQLLGADMYAKLYDTWAAEPGVLEIVVEDPNESFDDLRDRVDFTRLVDTGKIDLNTFSIKVAQQDGFLNDFKTAEKLEKRQLQRLLEMALLYQLKHGLSRDSKKDVRLYIKKRLYEKNKEALSDMDEPTMLDKLQTAYLALEDDYYRILEPVKLSHKRKAATDGKPTKKQKK
ncbi:acyl-CoA N-acyltransferase [Metschnikowia bicuspidata var. bicuspidata NRRL YB-4993]|uniref:Histone acetyltransferase type B catalytic subunit n=1 Tax=Metschnikowia bicuspidata var. bicuspidata NRRL YB-4993 TaxID=869754 RepID=A0A1A0HKG5_9ASCO|nr:acyl-CoA N-acyltransferase [Metschnikowia bicuspidata var. bicuspidata NRRL YB-4993]OBA24387.1 acyl-CoA N-acyltransferase [Metschnikowia bicuspidata var. bicuspidata NRRL YB-4993]